MTSESGHRRIVQRGTWLYDELVRAPVTIVELDYDFWYEIGRADGELEPWEVPGLNCEGKLYYVCFQSDPLGGWVDSLGSPTVAEARAWAGTKVPGVIRWGPLEPAR